MFECRELNYTLERGCNFELGEKPRDVKLFF